MTETKPPVLKARIHKDLMPYRNDFWYGMTVFTLTGRRPERYAPEDGNPQNRSTFTRTLNPRENTYFNDIRAAYSGTTVALIESFLLTVARHRDPDKFPVHSPVATHQEREAAHDL